MARSDSSDSSDSSDGSGPVVRRVNEVAALHGKLRAKEARLNRDSVALEQRREKLATKYGWINHQSFCYGVLAVLGVQGFLLGAVVLAIGTLGAGAVASVLNRE